MAIYDLILFVKQEGGIGQSDTTKTQNYRIGRIVKVVFGCIGVKI